MAERNKIDLLRTVAAVLASAALFAWPAIGAPQETVEHKPLPMHSLANASGRDGPLFQRVTHILASVTAGDDRAWADALSPNAKLQLESFVDGKFTDQPFDTRVIDAVSASCLGPYFVDESTTWVQFSWVCDAGGNTQLSRFLTFKDSPELSVTAFFDGEKINRLDAVEPLPLPGGRLLRMDAYQQMKMKVHG